MKNIDSKPPEVITNQEKKGEKKFQIIKGVRFEEGIPQEFIDDFFKSYNRELNKYEAEDDRTYIEHRSAGGSALSTIQPLKPYSIISGFKKPEELVKSRERAGPIFGFYNFDRNTNQTVLGGDNGGSIEIELDDSARSEFNEALEGDCCRIPNKNPLFFLLEMVKY